MSALDLSQLLSYVTDFQQTAGAPRVLVPGGLVLDSLVVVNADSSGAALNYATSFDGGLTWSRWGKTSTVVTAGNGLIQPMGGVYLPGGFALYLTSAIAANPLIVSVFGRAVP